MELIEILGLLRQGQARGIRFVQIEKRHFWRVNLDQQPVIDNDTGSIAGELEGFGEQTEGSVDLLTASSWQQLACLGQMATAMHDIRQATEQDAWANRQAGTTSNNLKEPGGKPGSLVKRCKYRFPKIRVEQGVAA
jgi:hypothetical protein